MPAAEGAVSNGNSRGGYVEAADLPPIASESSADMVLQKNAESGENLRNLDGCWYSTDSHAKATVESSGVKPIKDEEMEIDEREAVKSQQQIENSHKNGEYLWSLDVH